MSDAAKDPESLQRPPGPVYVVSLPGYSFTDALQMKVNMLFLLSLDN